MTNSLYQLIYILFLTLLFSLFRRLFTRSLMPVLAVSLSSLLFLYGLIQKYVLYPLYLSNIQGSVSSMENLVKIRLETGRIHSIFGLPTLYAMVCASLIMLLFHLLLQETTGRRYLYGILLFLGTWNLLLTKSFGSLVGLGGAVLFYLFFNDTLSKKYIAPVLMLLLLLFFILVGVRFSDAKSLQPVRLRLSNWFQALRLSGDHPWFGAGLGNYAVAVSPYIFPQESSSIYAHNIVLQTTAETGIPFSLFFWIIVFLFGYRQRYRFLQKENLPFTCAILINLFYNFTDIGIYFFVSGFLLIICLAWIFPRTHPSPKNLTRLLTLLVIIGAIWGWGQHVLTLQKEGIFYLSRGDREKAKIYFEKSLPANPSVYRSYIGIASCLYQEKKYDEADEYLQHALSLSPDSGFANYLLSCIRFRQGEYLEMLYYSRKANRSYPKNFQYRQWFEHAYTNFFHQTPAPGN